MLSGFADEHVKAAIVEGLGLRGMDVVTAQERGQRQADDEALLAVASGDGRLLLTNDTDFLRIHSLWLSQSRDHAGIVFWRQNLAIGRAVRRILQYALRTSADEAANAVHFL